MWRISRQRILNHESRLQNLVLSKRLYIFLSLPLHIFLKASHSDKQYKTYMWIEMCGCVEKIVVFPGSTLCGVL